MSTAVLDHHVRRWFTRAGVPLPPGAAAHAFRHTVAMQLIGLGESATVVQDLSRRSARFLASTNRCGSPRRSLAQRRRSRSSSSRSGAPRSCYAFDIRGTHNKPGGYSLASESRCHRGSCSRGVVPATSSICGSSAASVGHFRPGRVGEWPPSWSMARAMWGAGCTESFRDSGDESDLGVHDSIRPLDKPCSIAARIEDRCLMIRRCSATKLEIRDLGVQLIQISSASTASW